MTEAFKAELAMRTREYKNLIARGIDLLNDADMKLPSTHLGHNLANIATDLAAAAARVEAAESALRFFAKV